tara:strand:- start:230 stop:622 length:393 start_codon:yes stop_codon:yes gene_type:complete
MAEFEFPLKDYLNGINLKMGKLEDNERAMKKYPKYVVNKMLSCHMDCIIHVNEMNRYYNLDNTLQYQYFLYSIRKSKRFSPWQKQLTDNDLELVKEFYGYSNEKARTALSILSKEELEVIKAKLDTGGIK